MINPPCGPQPYPSPPQNVRSLTPSPPDARSHKSRKMGVPDAVQPDEPVAVYARWVCYAGGSHKHPEARTHVYSTSFLPTKPLSLGTRVRILATTPARYLVPEEDPDVYDAYDAHIVGTVSGVAGWKGRKVVLRIENECAANSVRSVKIRIPYVPEATVTLSKEMLPAGGREAFEADLNTEAVIRLPPGAVSCKAGTCCTPWRMLVGEGFLLEPMAEDVGERTGALGGGRKIPMYPTSWEEVAGSSSRR